jgi:hypothetical protein
MTGRFAGVVLAAMAIAIAGCGGSSKPSTATTTRTSPDQAAARKARQQGEAVGTATKRLVNSRSIADVQAAVPALQDALKGVQANVKDKSGAVQRQIKTQSAKISQSFDALKAAVGSGDVAGGLTAIDALQNDLKDIGTSAQGDISGDDAVATAFWTGVKDGYNTG